MLYDRIFGLVYAYTIKGLTSSTHYSLAVVEETTQTLHILDMATTSPTTPSTPPALGLTYIASGYVVLEMFSPADTGGAPLEGLPHVLVSSRQKQTWTSLPMTFEAGYLNLYGLNASTEYFIQYSVRNAAGLTSAFSPCHPLIRVLHLYWSMLQVIYLLLKITVIYVNI